MNRSGASGLGAPADEAEQPAVPIAALLRHPGLHDPALAWAVQPAHGVGGDAVAAYRTRSGRLLAMLADATGHGQAAAASLQPALQAFYAQAGRGETVEALARAINRRLQRAGRTGRFIAAVLVEVDVEGRRVAVWNGGMPAGLWVSRRRVMASAALRSVHLPLGILADTRFDATCARLETGTGGYLLFCSDGLIEAAPRGGDAFGAARLRRQLLAAADAEHAVARVQDALRVHLAGTGAADDVSLLAVRLGRIESRRE